MHWAMRIAFSHSGADDWRLDKRGLFRPKRRSSHAGMPSEIKRMHGQGKVKALGLR